MNALLPLIEQVIVDGIVSKKAPFMRKNKFGLGLMALSGFLFCAALICLIVATYSWLLIQFTQPVAALVLSGFILAIAILSALSGFLITQKKQPQPIQGDEITEILNAITDVIGEDLAQHIKDNPKAAVMLASTAGFVAGDRLN